MKTIQYNKLVRDKIPEIIEEAGKQCSIEILDYQTYLNYLDTKLHEELQEYDQDHSIEELADLLEVVYSVAKARGYSLESLEQVRKEKASKRGSFEKRILLKEVIEK